MKESQTSKTRSEGDWAGVSLQASWTGLKVEIGPVSFIYVCNFSKLARLKCKETEKEL